MPQGTKVSKCVKKVSRKYNKGAAIAICQKSTQQSYRTGKMLKKKPLKKVSKKK